MKEKRERTLRNKSDLDRIGTGRKIQGGKWIEIKDLHVYVCVLNIAKVFRDVAGGPLSKWKQMEELCNNKENLAVSLLTYPI